MSKLRSPGRRIGVHFARVAAFSAALTALTTIVVADVIAAEPIEMIEAAVHGELDELEEDTLVFAEREDDRVAVLAAAGVQVPDALPVALLDPFDDVLPEPEVAPKKKRRSKSKLKFGRFEGY